MNPTPAQLRAQADEMDKDADYHGHSDRESTRLMHQADNLRAEADRLEARPLFYLFKSWANWDAIHRQTLATDSNRATLQTTADTLNAARGIHAGCFYGVTDCKLVAYESLGTPNERTGR